jgi:regulator of sigma E protease
VNKEKIEDAEGFIKAVQNSGGEALKIVCERDHKTYTAEIEPVLTTAHQPGRVGISPRPLPLLRHYGWLKSIQVGFSKTQTVVIRIYLGMRLMISRRISARQQLGGPITIAVASYYFASQGVAKLLYFLGIISVGLVLINLLPLPVLDGGLLFLLGVEKIKGSPVSQKTQEVLNYIGWALIVSLMLWVTFFDILRLKDWAEKGLF